MSSLAWYGIGGGFTLCAIACIFKGDSARVQELREMYKDEELRRMAAGEPAKAS